jgi:hypothetical protein
MFERIASIYTAGMRRLAWGLGILALCGSVFVLVSTFVANRGNEQASTDLPAR